MTDTERAELKPLAERLREAAQEIASEGYNGWGNLMIEAADALELRLRASQGQLRLTGEQVTIPRDVAQALADSLKTLREADIFVWPNHVLNPETAILRALADGAQGDAGKEERT